jgi:mitochondrial translocator assembly and maintenance protein 41
VYTSNGTLLGQVAWQNRPRILGWRQFGSCSSLREQQKAQRQEQKTEEMKEATDSSAATCETSTKPSDADCSAPLSETSSKTSSFFKTNDPNQSLPPGWEDDPNFNITAFSELPHRTFGYNQHMAINEEFKETLRQMLWQFRAPIRYAFAYGSGVFPQSSSKTAPNPSLSPHPHPPEAILKWQQQGGKIIDFIFGVSYTQHWHSLNLHDHRDHYSFLGSLGSGAVSWVQDRWGAGVYFNPYITMNGTMIKYGVVNLDTIARDLSEWDTLYLAGRLQKPVKILRDDPRVRLANQVNLISAVRTALLMLPENFTEKQLYEAIAGISYMGDPRMSFKSENPNKVRNIVSNQLPNFRQLYTPLIEDLPNVAYNDPRCKAKDWLADFGCNCYMQQDMDPVKRGNMVRRLPKQFRKRLYFLYREKFGIPGSEFSKVMEESKDEDAVSFRRREGGEFDRRIATQDDIKDMVAKAIKQTVKWPSTSQSIKGFFTSGPTRSWRYVKEKREKGKEKKIEKKAEAKKLA